MLRSRPLLNRATVRNWAPQLVLVAVMGLAAFWLIGNMFGNLAQRGITIGFDFLSRAARFPISESLLSYKSTDSFGWAFVVGLGNTLFLSFIVIIISTLVGIFVGLARRSRHPLAYGVSSIFVDTIRNTPLVVQLLFWYGAVTIGLPSSQEAITPIAGVFLTDRGLYVPRIGIEGPYWPLLFVLAAGLVVAILAAWRVRRLQKQAGRASHLVLLLLVSIILTLVCLWIALGLRLTMASPHLGRFNFMGGVTLSPEFVAVVLGLVLYSSAFAAEIIRGGIDAVSKGQWEAGRAIGLSEKHTLKRVILPQALRVIVPPMTSQYINVIKNSTLALVVGYPELNFVTATTINHTGQAIEGILVLMLVFLAISATASLLMNRYNRHIALVER